MPISFYSAFNKLIKMHQTRSLKKIYNILVISILSVALSGCATVTTSRFQKVPFDSNPQGADVSVSSGQKGVTPCFFYLERNKKQVVTVSKAGYETVEITLKKSICWSTAGNMIIPGLLGIFLDTFTGAMCKIIPEEVHVDLQNK
ncbi:MAG: PEGA domain-containing protein [Candidatus Omnitrophica bacterium]|nr:PEGA domain-containing protein [Candidatus Omnitrophota bacterium]